jgi:hypothetical protein
LFVFRGTWRLNGDLSGRGVHGEDFGKATGYYGLFFGLGRFLSHHHILTEFLLYLIPDDRLPSPLLFLSLSLRSLWVLPFLPSIVDAMGMMGSEWWRRNV